MAEGAPLLREIARNGNGGSNPSLSAKIECVATVRMKGVKRMTNGF